MQFTSFKLSDLEIYFTYSYYLSTKPQSNITIVFQNPIIQSKSYYGVLITENNSNGAGCIIQGYLFYKVRVTYS